MKKRQERNEVVEVSASPISQNRGNDVISIDLQNFLTPAAIVIAGLMVSLTLFFSMRNDQDAVLGTNTNTTTTTGTTPTAANPTPTPTAPAAAGDTGFEDATISIDDDPILGDRNSAKLAIVEFSDYECPFCVRHFTETHKLLYDNYISTGDVIMVYRDLPLSFHPQAKPAAVAANCAREQGGDSMYYSYHDLLFGKGVVNGATDFKAYAEELGLNMGDFNDCYASGKYDAEIQADITDGNNNNCTGTPCFIVGELTEDGQVINGKRIGGAYPYATFQTMLDEMLQ